MLYSVQIFIMAKLLCKLLLSNIWRSPIGTLAQCALTYTHAYVKFRLSFLWSLEINSIQMLLITLKSRFGRKDSRGNSVIYRMPPLFDLFFISVATSKFRPFGKEVARSLSQRYAQRRKYFSETSIGLKEPRSISSY